MRTTFLLGGRVGSAFASTVHTSEYQKIEQQKDDADSKGYGEGSAIILVVGVGENLPHSVEATVSMVADGVVGIGSSFVRIQRVNFVWGAHWTHAYGDVGALSGEAGRCVFGSFGTFGNGSCGYWAGWR